MIILEKEFLLKEQISNLEAQFQDSAKLSRAEERNNGDPQASWTPSVGLATPLNTFSLAKQINEDL